jgi:hypothetical protein
MSRSTRAILALVTVGAACAGFLAMERWLVGTARPIEVASSKQASPNRPDSSPSSSADLVEPSAISSPGRLSVPESSEDQGVGLSTQIDPDGLIPSDKQDAYMQWRSEWPTAQDLPPFRWVGEWIPIDTAVFEQKYANYSSDELQAASVRTKDELRAKVKDAFSERLERGTYESYKVDPTRPVHAGPRRSNAPIRRVTVLAGGAEVHVTQLPFDEYPNIYALKDEAVWLATVTSAKEQ